ncbi:SIS domain-containing protein [Carnobacterium sp.]|uniref:SIS domain-containing protein n=1 Tax=Carnobacterium sp. TaxID=48221 RepID=UPI0028A6D898|nr:SIS domain-containing protein [Carnobacterium sp.]
MKIETSMLDTIKSIPEKIQERLTNVNDFSGKLKDIKTVKVTIIASGTSYNAAFTAKSFIEEKLGMGVELIYPNFFYHHFNKESLSLDEVYLFISQGGTTKSVLESIEMVNNLGGTTISITENLDNPISEAAQINFDMGSGKEPYVFRTAGYTLTTVTLYLIFMEISKQNKKLTNEAAQKYLEELSEISKDIENAISFSQKWYRQNKKFLFNCEAFFFAGGGALWPVAQESDIKFMEMVPIITNSFEIEELIHGPQNCFTEDMGFFLLAEEQEDYEKAVKINSFLHKEVHAYSQIISRNRTDDSVVTLETAAETFYPLIYMTFFQVISYLLATDKGRDLSEKIYPQIEKYINKTV